MSLVNMPTQISEEIRQIEALISGEPGPKGVDPDVEPVAEMPATEDAAVCAAPVAQDTSGIRVESGVPMPTKHHRAVYPIDQMDVGNSIAMPLSDRSKLRAAADAHRKKNAGWGYISRTEDGVFRIWRTS